MIREPGHPCQLCGAARTCQHSEVEPPRLLREAIPVTLNKRASRDGLERGTGGGRDHSGSGFAFKRYSMPRSAKRDGPRKG